MPSRIVSIPFVIALLTVLYLTWRVSSSYAIYLAPPMVILAVIYVLSPQIDWWWYVRNPPDLPGTVRQMFFQYPFYQRLPEGEKKRFRSRVAMFAMGNEFIPQAMEKIPDDLKYIISACAVTLTFGQEEFLFKKFENIILMPRPFPTPQYPENFHASEVYEPDGAVLFSAEQLALGFMQSKQYYNIGLHEYANVFIRSNPQIDFPELDEDTWTALERISGFSKDWIDQWINRPDVEVLPVSIAHFFTFPEAFRQELPEVFERYREIFKM